MYQFMYLLYVSELYQFIEKSDHQAEWTSVLDKCNLQHVQPDFDKKAIRKDVAGRNYQYIYEISIKFL